MVVRICEGNDDDYTGVSDDASPHAFSFHSQYSPRALTGMSSPQKGDKSGWYSTSTTRQIFNTADVGDVLCIITNSDDAPIILRPYIVKPIGGTASASGSALPSASHVIASEVPSSSVPVSATSSSDLQ